MDETRKKINEIESAEEYFTKTGENSKLAFEILDQTISLPHKETQIVFLYIPGTLKDMFTINLN
jgi:hypothetical protein